MEKNIIIPLSDGYEKPIFGTLYQISSTATNDEGDIPFVLYFIFGRNVHVAHGIQYSDKNSFKIAEELNKGMEEFDREEKRRRFASMQELFEIYLD